MRQFDKDNIALPFMLAFSFFLLVHLKFDLYIFLAEYRRFRDPKIHVKIWQYIDDWVIYEFLFQLSAE